MRRELEEVLALQEMWTSTNTIEMSLRGDLIRREIPRGAHPVIEQLKSRMPSHFQDLSIEGRDATGLKSEIPWVRIFSKSRSRRATEGWYLVYLFGAFGEAAYLSLNQGTTRWDRGEYRARPSAELAERARWARALLTTDLKGRRDLQSSISLPTRSTKLGQGYEFGNVLAIRYDGRALPPESHMLIDLEYMAELLTVLYEDLDRALIVPGELAPEVQDAVELAEVAAGGNRLVAGYRLNAAERKAIERCAVDAATSYLVRDGYRVKDVGSTRSYDLHAVRDGEKLIVEVKGTVSSGSDVILTRNEVAIHTLEYPHNMLAVLSGIQLDRGGTKPVATGGKLKVLAPWQIDEVDLTPLSFSYRTPPMLIR